MILQRKYALEWQPRPGFPSTDGKEWLARGAAAGCPAFDQYEYMLIYNSAKDAQSAEALMMQTDRDAVESYELLMVPNRVVVEPTDRFSDFAFASDLTGHIYFDLASIAVFRLFATKPGAEPAPALMQLEEHLMATLLEHPSSDKSAWQVIERQLAELADRVARAYHCEVEWLDTDNL